MLMVLALGSFGSDGAYMKILYVYKLNPQDPTEHALRKWFVREGSDFAFFEFENHERSRDSDFHEGCLRRFQEKVEEHQATHVFCWVPYLNPAEVKWLRARGICVAMAVNGITALSHGNCHDQTEFFEYLQLLNWYFIPHAPHVALLREKGINAAELPFCYDDEAFHPLAFASALRYMMPFRGSYIGNFGGKENAQGKYRAELVRQFVEKFPMLVLCDSRYRDHGLGGKNFYKVSTLTHPTLLNLLLNASGFALGTDAFPEIDQSYRQSYRNVLIPYDRIRDAFVMRPRSFWSMGAGIPFVVENYPEIRRYFTHAEHLLLWDSPKEAVEILVEFSKEPSRLFAMAARGQARVKALHSARVRVKQIISILAGGVLPDFALGAP